jgi:hypothetical protein
VSIGEAGGGVSEKNDVSEKVLLHAALNVVLSSYRRMQVMIRTKSTSGSIPVHDNSFCEGDTVCSKRVSRYICGATETGRARGRGRGEKGEGEPEERRRDSWQWLIMIVNNNRGTPIKSILT